MDVTNDRLKLKNCKCVVGTPGRILHLIKNNVINTVHLQLLVLDEADKLMTEPFRTDLMHIIKYLPIKRQTICASATFAKEIENQLVKIMKNPVGVTPKKEAPVLLGVKQFGYIMKEETNLSKEMFDKIEVMKIIFSNLMFKQCIVFSNSLQRADSYCNYLRSAGWDCDVITGAMNQPDRLKIFKKFKAFDCRILISTDLMARGIDSESVNLVINLDVPFDAANYLHRVGRSGRFGSQGIAITLISSNDYLKNFKNLLKSIGDDMKVLKFPSNIDSDELWDFSENSVELYEMIGTDQDENIDEQANTSVSGNITGKENNMMPMNTNGLIENLKSNFDNVREEIKPASNLFDDYDNLDKVEIAVDSSIIDKIITEKIPKSNTISSNLFDDYENYENNDDLIDVPHTTSFNLTTDSYPTASETVESDHLIIENRSEDVKVDCQIDDNIPKDSESPPKILDHELTDKKVEHKNSQKTYLKSTNETKQPIASDSGFYDDGKSRHSTTVITSNSDINLPPDFDHKFIKRNHITSQTDCSNRAREFWSNQYWMQVNQIIEYSSFARNCRSYIEKNGQEIYRKK